MLIAWIGLAGWYGWTTLVLPLAPQVDPASPLALALFGLLTGTAALFAPCAFPFFPAYVTLYLTLDEQAGGLSHVRWALWSGLVCGLGAVVFFLLGGTPFRVVGIYATGNDFGDNHVIIPLEVFRRIFQPGEKLSKIFVTVDLVRHVEAVVEDLQAIPEADVVIASEAVSTAKTTLTAIAATSQYGALVVFVAGGVLVAYAMVLSTRERVQEIGVLKPIGAANSELVGQFVAEALALTLVAGVGALGVGVLAQSILQRTLGLMLRLDAMLFLLILGSALVFASLGTLYPIIHGIRVSPVEAMREE